MTLCVRILFVPLADEAKGKWNNKDFGFLCDWPLNSEHKIEK